MSHSYIGRRCTANNAVGYVRFVGNTKFAPGVWIGVELDEAEGKNDGSVQDERYFSCKSGHGVFVRAAKLTFLNHDLKTLDNASSIDEAQDTTTFKVPFLAKDGSQKTPSRLSRPISRMSMASTAQADLSDLSKTAALERESFTSQASTEMTHESVPRVDRQLVSPRPGIGPRSRSLLTSKASPALRRSISSTSHTTSKYAKPSSTLPADLVHPLRASLQGSSQQIISDVQDVHEQSTVEIGKLSTQKSGALPSSSPVRTSPDHEEPPKTIVERKKETQDFEALQRLTAKILLLENQRQDDIRRLSNLGALEAEKQAWINIKAKLRDKLQTQQLDIKVLRDRIKVLEQELEAARTRSTSDEDASGINTRDILEMAMLDREVAEEQRDQLRADLREVQTRNEELVLELEILKESEDLSQLHTDQLSVTDHRSIELQNERLREALLRLKQVTNDQDDELSSGIKESEILRSANTELSTQLKLTTSQLDDMAVLVNDLKEQIDLQIGAEEMLESLTERNLYLGEQVELCRIEVADLETLRTLNDELDEDHAIVVRELQAEISLHTETINDQNRRIKVTDVAMSDYANTVKKFQDMIVALRAQIEYMKQQGHDANLETEKLSSQATDLLSKNAILERQERKVNVFLTDQELSKIDIVIALEHLAIVAHYMPKSYEKDKIAIENYLGLRKMSSLLQILHKLLASELQDSDEGDLFVFTSVFTILQLRNIIEALTAAIQLSSIDDFIILGASALSFQQCQDSLQEQITAISAGAVRQKALQTSLTRISSFVNELRAQFSSITAPHWMPSTTTILEYVQVLQKTLNLLASKSDPEAVEEGSSVDNQKKPHQQVIESIKIQCRQLIRIDEESKIDSPEALSDIMQQLLTLSETLMSSCQQTQIIKEESVVVIDSACTALRKLHQDLEHLISDVLTQDRRQPENPTLPPWAARGTLLQQSVEKELESDVTLKGAQQEVVGLVLQLHSLEKAFEEEKVRSQALNRRLNEHLEASRKLQELQDQASKFEEEQHISLNTITVLKTQIARMEEENLSKQSYHSNELPMVNQTLQAGQDIHTEEIRILRGTVRHLSKELNYSRATNKEDLEFLSRPLCNVEPIIRSPFAKEYYQAVRQFSEDLEVIDFNKTAPAQTKWVAASEKCGYIHYVQEEKYTKLLAMGRELRNRVF